MVDIALEKEEDFSSSLNTQKLNLIRDSLIYSIAKLIDIALKDRGKYHDPFVNNLFNLDEKIWRKVSFINLNYDILLDNALVRLYETKELYLDYGIDFRNFVAPVSRNQAERREFIQNVEDWYIPQKDQSVLLLKPHGSLNWLYCPTCNTIKTTKTEKGGLRIYDTQEICGHDESLQKILIVPPTWGKIYDNSHLTRIAAKTDEILRKAKIVYFVGCSLSDVDIKLKYLFKRALYEPAMNLAPKIIAIQDKKEDKKREDEIKDRYCRLFGNVTFDFNGFEFFSEHVSEFFKEP